MDLEPSGEEVVLRLTCLDSLEGADGAPRTAFSRDAEARRTPCLGMRGASPC